MARQIVTANRLTDGRVVYLTADHAWSEAIAEATIAETDERAAALLAEAERQAKAPTIVGPYLIELNEADGRPRRGREAIRAEGPSVETLAFETRRRSAA